MFIFILVFKSFIFNFKGCLTEVFVPKVEDESEKAKKEKESQEAANKKVEKEEKEEKEGKGEL